MTLAGFHSLLATAVALRPFAPGVIHQNAPHSFRRGGDEMRAIVPLSIFILSLFGWFEVRWLFSIPP
jgi:hypothetical protein